MPLRIRRGIEADRTGFTPLEGEPIYVTDTKKVYIGDGSTAGGVNISQALTVDTQDFTASGTWTKPANALWVEVTMCGAGQPGQAGNTSEGGRGGSAGRNAQKTFLSSDLSATVTVTCGSPDAWASPTIGSQSSFGTMLYAAGPSGGPNDTNSGQSFEASASATAVQFGIGGDSDFTGLPDGNHGSPLGPGGGGAGGHAAGWQAQSAGGVGGKAATGSWSGVSMTISTGGGGAGGASGATGTAGTAGGYDTVTGFGHGGGGGGEGTGGAGGAGGAGVRGGGGGGGGKGTTTGGAGGAGGAGFVRVRTLCFG